MTADYKDRMKDYVPVNERIDQFYRAHPEGSIQSEIVELTESRVTVKAYAYRKPDDPRPGMGHSSLNIPGSTPYTKGSEIENAETSAWGRAIAALGFEVKRGISSAEEVANKATEAAAAPTRKPRAKKADGPTDEQIASLTEWLETADVDAADVKRQMHIKEWDELSIEKIEALTNRAKERVKEAEAREVAAV